MSTHDLSALPRCVPPATITASLARHTLMVTDEFGTRSHGFFYEHDPIMLARWDAHLDSLDAAHEGPDGSIARAAA